MIVQITIDTFIKLHNETCTSPDKEELLAQKLVHYWKLKKEVRALNNYFEVVTLNLNKQMDIVHTEK